LKIFLKKVAKKFGGFAGLLYLCSSNRIMQNKSLTVNRSVASAMAGCMWYRALCFVKSRFKSGKQVRSKIVDVLSEHYGTTQINSIIDAWYDNRVATDFSVRVAGAFTGDPVIHFVDPSKIRFDGITDKELKQRLVGFCRTKDTATLQFPLCLAPKPFKALIVLSVIQSKVRSFTSRQSVVVDYNITDGCVRYIRNNRFSPESSSREILAAQKEVKKALSNSAGAVEVAEVHVSQRFISGVTGFSQGRVGSYISFLKDEGLLGVETRAVVISEKKEGSYTTVSSFCDVMADLRPGDKARLSFCVTSAKKSFLDRYDVVDYAARELQELGDDCCVNYAIFTTAYFVPIVRAEKPRSFYVNFATLPYPSKKRKNLGKSLA
jgi:hypothetical protein